MTRTLARLAIVLAVLLIAAPVPAEARWSPNVHRARLWLKARTSDGAFACAHRLWANESSWSPTAGTLTGSYGIPQANPGRRMRSFGTDWRWNATTQVKWGTHYVRDRHGSFCKALRFQNRNGWY
jgi:hypothetical protein